MPSIAYGRSPRAEPRPEDILRLCRLVANIADKKLEAELQPVRYAIPMPSIKEGCIELRRWSPGPEDEYRVGNFYYFHYSPTEIRERDWPLLGTVAREISRQWSDDTYTRELFAGFVLAVGIGNDVSPTWRDNVVNNIIGHAEVSLAMQKRNLDFFTADNGHGLVFLEEFPKEEAIKILDIESRKIEGILHGLQEISKSLTLADMLRQNPEHTEMYLRDAIHARDGLDPGVHAYEMAHMRKEVARKLGIKEIMDDYIASLAETHDANDIESRRGQISRSVILADLEMAVSEKVLEVLKKSLREAQRGEKL